MRCRFWALVLVCLAATRAGALPQRPDDGALVASLRSPSQAEAIAAARSLGIWSSLPGLRAMAHVDDAAVVSAGAGTLGAFTRDLAGGGARHQ
jgi:hypothetical protein